MTFRYIEVLLDVPLPPLDYVLPKGESASVGERVVVPLGARRKDVGIIVRVKDDTAVPEGKLRQAAKVFHDIDPLSSEWLSFTRFAADYYVKPWGEAAIPALPLFFSFYAQKALRKKS